MVIDKFANKEYLNASSTCECECEWTGPSHLCSMRVLTCSCTVVAEADGMSVQVCQSSLVFLNHVSP